jgi:hypothetical protein
LVSVIFYNRRIGCQISVLFVETWLIESFKILIKGDSSVYLFSKRLCLNLKMYIREYLTKSRRID